MSTSAVDWYAKMCSRNPGLFRQLEEAVQPFLCMHLEQEERDEEEEEEEEESESADSATFSSLTEAIVDEVRDSRQLAPWLIGKLDQAIISCMYLEAADEECFIDYCLTKVKELNQLKREIQTILLEPV